MEFKIKNREFTLKFNDSSFDLYEIKISKTGKSIGQRSEQIVGYFTNLQLLFDKLLKIALSVEDKHMKTLEDILGVLSACQNKINEIMKIREKLNEERQPKKSKSR